MHTFKPPGRLAATTGAARDGRAGGGARNGAGLRCNSLAGGS